MFSRLKGLFILAAWLAAVPVGAVNLIALQVGDLTGQGMAVEALEVDLRLDEDKSPSLHLGAERLVIGDQVLAPVKIDCPRFDWTTERIRCRGGRLQLAHPYLDAPGAAVELTWHMRERRLRLQVDDLKSAGGSLQLDVTAQFGERGLVQADWRLQARGLTFSVADDAYLGASLSGSVAGNWRPLGDGGEGDLRLSLSGGELLTPYFYLAPGDAPVSLAMRTDWDASTHRLTLRRIAFRHPGLLELDGSATLTPRPFTLQALELRSADTRAADLYQAYFQPVLAATLLERVDWQGGFRLSARQMDGGPMRVSVQLRDLGLQDAPDPALTPGRKPRFALHGLNGELHWSDGGNGDVSRLRWQGGQVLDSLDIGPASLQLVLQGNSLSLHKDTEIPLLDGSLWVDQLDVRAVPDATPEVDFDAVLTPVTLARLSRAFGWPELSGSLSGVLPGLTLRGDGLRVGGQLLVRAFDGDVLIEHLRLKDLFGSWPELFADVRIKGLDLEQLTGAFSFGKITGRLDGRVDGLRLENWQPEAFDARFATPPNDDSRHTISQRAVDNISNLGGAGIAGSLSRTFLGIFEDFGYERIGIGCKLRDGVCRMSGVKPAEQGYYLVIGSGIPQINIKGFNRETDWNRLVEQLKQISAGGTPVVE